MAASLAADKRKLLAGETASWALVQALGEDSVKVDKSPVTLLKALKNPVELE
ncbi:hypothetical protein EC988_009927, partial [Linderina pennispora]